jgi:hypothetical protein
MELVAEIEKPIEDDKFKVVPGEIRAKQGANEDDRNEMAMFFKLVEGQVYYPA